MGRNQRKEEVIPGKTTCTPTQPTQLEIKASLRASTHHHCTSGSAKTRNTANNQEEALVLSRHRLVLNHRRTRQSAGRFEASEFQNLRPIQFFFKRHQRQRLSKTLENWSSVPQHHLEDGLFQLWSGLTSSHRFPPQDHEHGSMVPKHPKATPLGEK